MINSVQLLLCRVIVRIDMVRVLVITLPIMILCQEVQPDDLIGRELHSHELKSADIDISHDTTQNFVMSVSSPIHVQIN